METDLLIYLWGLVVLWTKAMNILTNSPNMVYLPLKARKLWQKLAENIKIQ